MPLYEKSHVDHDQHLCSLVAEGIELSDYKDLVRNPKYICRVCGRAVASEKNLCDPVPI
jgi:rubrerythrin